MPGLRARTRVAVVPVGLHVALVVADDPEGHPRGAAGFIAIDHHRLIRRTAARHPHVAGVGVGALGLLEYLHGGLVDLQDRSATQLVEQRLHQRPAGAGRRDHPVRHRAPRQLDSKARELPLLPVQRQRVAELRRGDERQQPLRGQSLRDQRRRRRRDPHRRMPFVAGALAVMAGVPGPHRADHLHLRRDHVELLGGVLADAHQVVAAFTLLVLLGQVDDPLDAPQRLRQRSAPRATAGSLKHFRRPPDPGADHPRALGPLGGRCRRRVRSRRTAGSAAARAAGELFACRARTACS